MAMIGSRSIDRLNIALIALACLAAHLFPYRLLILSYAILGPAHYLTQISWLHDRHYFATTSFVAPICILLSLLLLFVPGYNLSALWLSLALGIALMAVMPQRWPWRVAGGLCGGLLTWLTISYGPAALFIAALLPTVLHVFVFTACFMCVGALKTGNMNAWLALLALLIGAASFLLPATPLHMPDWAGLGLFKGVVLYIKSLLHISAETNTQLFGFLSFAYTYHYLNWFSKAEIICWHRIPRRRLLAIVLIYLAAVALYTYNYKTGFMVLLFLSVLHVLLEFPLNLRSFAIIAGALVRPSLIRKAAH